MNFLQPILLAALPIIALPIVIHLINQRRYQTIRWGAMMFLLAANRMSRGYARVRQWLILLFRTLALAGLVFAISRPLASGWVGLAAGGRADTTLILLDRSPSMQQERPGAASSKLETGRRQLVSALSNFSSSRWVLIESTTNVSREIESPGELLSLPATEATSASADVPSMPQAASDYIRTNKPGRTEIWICSDMRENDWSAEDGRWQALRDSFIDSTGGVRFHLLAYPERAQGNVGVRVTGVRVRKDTDAAELLVSLQLWRESGDGTGGASTSAEGRVSVPVQFEIEGARSELSIEMSGPEFELVDHRIPLEHDRRRGWGKVSIPADTNPADNDHYFVFDEPSARHAVIVSDDSATARTLELAATISPDPALATAAEVFTPEQIATLEWEKIALLVWHAPLPTGETAKRVEAVVDRGGSVVFFPPRVPGTTESFAGIEWQSWEAITPPLGVATWRGDQDLLAHTQSGSALPVGNLEIRRFCGFAGEHTALAVLRGGRPLLGRATTERGGVWFCATTPAPADSSLATNGVVLYVLVQRALAAGASLLGNTRQVEAGIAALASGDAVTNWKKLAGAAGSISTDFAFHSGVYGVGEKLFALNAPDVEDRAAVLPDDRVAGLFRGLDYSRVDDSAGSLASLVDEIWRPFLAAMIAALIIEALLCLPRIQPKAAPAGAKS
jgi:hypothetical protein